MEKLTGSAELRPDERLNGLERLAIHCRVEAEAPAQNHAWVRQAEWLPAVPAYELTFRALLPKAAAGFLLTGFRRGGPGRSNWCAAPEYSVIWASAPARRSRSTCAGE